MDFDKLKKVNQKDKDIVVGYTKQIKINLPNEIIDIILLFLYIKYYKFENNPCPERFKFMNETTIKKIGINASISCIFGEEIDGNKYSKCEIEIKWIKCVCQFYMGFFTKNIKTLQKSKYWEHQLVHHSDKCMSIYVWNGYQSFKPYGILKNKWKNKFKYYTKERFGMNDIFGLTVDFEQDTLTIYHNHKIAETVSMGGYKLIIPAFSMYAVHEQLEVTRCNVYYKKQ